MTSTLPRKIIIVDSHPSAQRALSQFIQSQTDFVVSQICSDWQALLSGDGNVYPGIVLLDWESPGIGRAALARIRAALAQVTIIAMGVWQASRRNALAAGVDGFINKTDAPEQVLAILRRVEMI